MVKDLGGNQRQIAARLEIPYANFNGMVNRNLKLIAATLGLPSGLSTHWARHTFAHMASRSGIPANDIRMILGHSTLGTTTRYLARFDRSAVTDAITKLFGE